VLFTITYNLHKLGLSIHVAKISTNVDQVADVFYVTDQAGRKLDNPAEVENVRQFMHQCLVPQNETSERVA
jgi:[protein-PII] uridylyltransferase